MKAGRNWSQILTAAAATAGLVFGVLWIRSLYRVDVLSIWKGESYLSFIVGGGAMRFTWLRGDYTPHDWMIENGMTVPPPEPGWRFERHSGSVDEEGDLGGYTNLTEHIINQGDAWPLNGQLGFFIRRGTPAIFFSGGPPLYNGWQITAPYWLLTTGVLLCLLPPARQMLHQRRNRRRLAAGLCGHCGYDLRATPDRCPECGTVRGRARA
jgi:hypothetical protein